MNSLHSDTPPDDTLTGDLLTGDLPAVSRRDMVRARLDQILAMPAGDSVQWARQERLVAVLQALHGRDEVAAAYEEWLDRDLARQGGDAAPLTSWDQVPIAYSPVPAWTRDRYGHLCVICGEAVWQVVTCAGGDRLCRVCARREEQTPGQVWLPRLPAVHGALGYPGLLAGEPCANQLRTSLAEGSELAFDLGDADPFCLPEVLGLQPDPTSPPDAFTGDPRCPRLKVTGQAGAGVRYQAAFRFDPTPQGWRAAPYGFRFTRGTLTSDGRTTAFQDAFDLLAALEPTPTDPAPTDPAQGPGTQTDATLAVTPDPGVPGTPAATDHAPDPGAAGAEPPLGDPAPADRGSADGRPVDRAVAGRSLEVARQVTRDADAKAGALLTATGVLTAAAAVLIGPAGRAAATLGGPAGALARAGTVVAGAGLLAALLALLAVLIPRGPRPDRWLAGQPAPAQELARIGAIAARKHVLLRVAVAGLVLAVLAAAAAAVVVVVGLAAGGVGSRR